MTIFVDSNRHAIQAVQENLNSSVNPGLNGRSLSALRFKGVTTFKPIRWDRVLRKPPLILHGLAETASFGTH